MAVFKVLGALLVAAPFAAILGACWYFEGFYVLMFVATGAAVIMGSIIGGIALLTSN